MMAAMWKAVTPGRALGNIVCLAVPVAISGIINVSNSVMALGWVGQYLKSEVIMSGVSLGEFCARLEGSGCSECLVFVLSPCHPLRCVLCFRARAPAPDCDRNLDVQHLRDLDSLRSVVGLEHVAHTGRGPRRRDHPHAAAVCQPHGARHVFGGHSAGCAQLVLRFDPFFGWPAGVCLCLCLFVASTAPASHNIMHIWVVVLGLRFGASERAPRHLLAPVRAAEI
jgi:hypothetical protein